MKRNNSGFTLMESIIVIIIVGLLLVGVFSGRELIRRSQTVRVIKQIEEFTGAYENFLEKYDCTPGDCENAYEFFGDDCDTNPDNCNGTGDGTIQDWTLQPNNNEAVRFWQHLSLAGFIPGRYRGTGQSSEVGITVPRGPIGNAGYTMQFSKEYYPDSLAQKSMWGWHTLTFGLPGPLHTNLPVFVPDEAYLIDAKIDDGLPDKGIVGVAGDWWAGWIPNCKTLGTYPNSTYILSNSDVACHIIVAVHKD